MYFISKAPVSSHLLVLFFLLYSLDFKTNYDLLAVLIKISVKMYIISQHSVVNEIK